ncbi:MAG TPA: O-antigen ligase family protein [Humisphaera sp.]|nr:O-antigen ligase family protein [Humisphaera sp.]
MNLAGALAIVYIILFIAVTAKRPKLALMLTFASAPFQNDLSGDLPVRFSLAEVNLVLSLLLVLVHTGPKRLRFGPLLIPVLLYFAVCMISSLRAWRGTTTISIMQTALYMIGAVLVFSSLGESIEAYKLSFYWLIAVGVFTGGPALVIPSSFLDLGLNKNGIGGSLACCLLVVTELWLNSNNPKHRRILLTSLVVIAGGLVMTLSRGSWLGALAGLMALFAIKAQFKALFQTLVVLAPVVAICWILLPAESQDFATGFDVKRTNISARLDSIEFAERQFQIEPILGVGVGLRKEFDATNVVMTVLAETGILGLATFALIHVAFFWMVYTVRRRISPTSSACSILAIGGALLTSQVAHGLVDHYWSRGSLMLAWAGVGMVTRCYFDLGDVVFVAVARPLGRRMPSRPREMAAAVAPAAEFPARMAPMTRPKRGHWNRPIRRLDTERD